MASFTLTAGYTHSLPTVLIGEGILRAGHKISSVLIVSPWQIRRIQEVITQRGIRWLSRRMGLDDRSMIGPSRIESFADEMGVRSSKINTWALDHDVPVKIVNSLNAFAAISELNHRNPDAVIYTGGGIIRADFIRAAGITLNAHAGPLPEIRGMNAAEWTCLLGLRPEITIHHIDEGIDTGPPVSFRGLDDHPADVDDLRDLAVLAGVKEMIAVISEERWRHAVQCKEASCSRQCFVMAPSIRELLNQRLMASL